MPILGYFFYISQGYFYNLKASMFQRKQLGMKIIAWFHLTVEKYF